MVDVSVLITCYNKEKYLDECISSVVRQTKKPREIILVHDACSEPMHHAACTSLMLKNNIGVSRARDEAVRYSRGKLILFVDGDDILSPDYIEKMILAMESCHADIIYPDMYFFGDVEARLVITHEEPNLPFIRREKKFPIPVTSLMSRETYEKLHGFSDLPVLEDLDFFLRALAHGYVFTKAQTLLWYRQEGIKRNAIPLDVKKRIIDEIFDQFVITDISITKK